MFLATFVYCIGSGFIPVLNAEVYLIAASMTSGPGAIVPLALAATAGQMVAKSLMYLGGRGVLKLPLGRYKDRLEAAGQRLEASRFGAAPFIGLSSLTGVPPFYLTSILAGGLRLPFVFVFFVPGGCGRLVRFGLVALFPQFFQSLAR